MTEALLKNEDKPEAQSLIATEKEEAKVTELKKIPAGKVERSLNFRDRLLIINGCAAYADKAGKNNYKRMIKLKKVKKELLVDEVQDYFDMIVDCYSEKVDEWTLQQNLYRGYRAWQIGAMSKEKLLERFPDFNFEEPPKKPAQKKAPKADEEEERGKPRSFFLPRDVDLFIEAALKEMPCASGDADFIAELAEKYELPEDEKDDE